jgi:2,4-dienoyl-CoA reductase (NADPH2)
VTGEAVIELLKRASAAARAGGDGGPGAVPVGERVAIVGGNLIGVELAEHLARLGRRVSVLDPGRRFAMPAGKKRRGDHSGRMDAAGVSVNTRVEVKAIVDEGVVIAAAGGPERVVAADSVIVVGQPVADEGAAEPFASVAPDVYSVGDAGGFGLSQKAVREAIEVAYRI